MDQAEYTFVRCGECDAKNKIPSDHESAASSGGQKITCGKCHQPLILEPVQQVRNETYK